MRQNILLLITFLVLSYVHSQSSLRIPELSDDASNAEVISTIDTIQVRMLEDFYKSNFVEVLSYGDKGLELSRRIGNVTKELEISRFIGSALVRMKDSVRAKKLFTSSLDKALGLNDSLLIANAITDLGNFSNEQKNFNAAIRYYKKAISYLKNQNNVRQLYVLHYNLSDIYLDKSDIENAQVHVNGLTLYNDSIKAPMFKSGYHLSIGKLLLLKGKEDKAIVNFIKAIDIAKTADYRDGIIESYEFYLKALIVKKDFEKAHYERLKLDEYRNEKFELEKLAAINEVTAKMNVDQYKQELIAKNLENELNRQKAYKREIMLYIAIASTLILFISITFLFANFRNRKKLVTDLQQKNIMYLEAKKNAEELSQVKTNFLSAISHELRTPLYGIIGISSILEENVKLAEHKEDLNSLKFSADYLLSLVNDLLYLNKLEAFKNEKLELKPFKPRELITSIINSFEFMRTKNNNIFDVTIDSSVPEFLKGDFVKLSQILMNLIGNACKFTDEGTIKVSIDSTGVNEGKVSLHFCIADDGLGISKEKQAVIFDEFTQDTNENHFQGTGLGLSIVKKLLDLHRSPITLKSEKGVGTEFQFTIDYVIAAAHEFDVIQREENVDKHFEGSHILIVDDNRINRLVTQKTLERDSYICSTAVNGKDAVEIVKNEVFDLILMDLNMPIMNGFEATTLIREFNETIPIIALTARDPVQLEEDIHAIGFNDVIIKPYDINVFLDTVKRNFISTIKV